MLSCSAVDRWYLCSRFCLASQKCATCVATSPMRLSTALREMLVERLSYFNQLLKSDIFTVLSGVMSSCLCGNMFLTQADCLLDVSDVALQCKEFNKMFFLTFRLHQ